MKTFQAAHLPTGDVAKVATLSDGKFDDTVLYKLTPLITINIV
jgi:hypothetical protein